MKIALLSGADKNAGDFLIVHRAKLLLEQAFPQAEIMEFRRNDPLDAHLDEVNSCDCLVFAGGPGYMANMYPDRFPLVADLNDLKPPLFALGMGNYSPTVNRGRIPFTEQSRVLLERLESDGFGLGCRDKLTAALLKNSGFHTAVFTGCPAWFDSAFVALDDLATAPSREEIGSIAVSDAAIYRNIDAPKALIAELKTAFPGARILLVFHRGWSTDRFSNNKLAVRQADLAEWAKANDVSPMDISYGDSGFAVYDSCDLHIGFRVHAHLYTISHRRPSFLIEEDARGWGANDALGISEHFGLIPGSPFVSKLRSGAARAGIRSPERHREANVAKAMVAYMVQQIDDGYPQLRAACRKAAETHTLMTNHLNGLRVLE